MNIPLTVTPPTFRWSDEVRAYAASQEVEQYLDPLLAAARRVFPGASLNVDVHQDPELRDVRFIVFHVRVPDLTLAKARTLRKEWHETLFAICPAPKVCTFCLHLEFPN